MKQNIGRNNKGPENEKNYAVHTFDLTKKYGERIAVNAVNLSIKKGELFSLLGPASTNNRRISKQNGPKI